MKKNFLIFLSVLTIFLLILNFLSNISISVNAKSQQELENELMELQKKLEEIKKQKDAASKNLEDERKKQSNLSKDINYLSSEIQQKELDIQEKETIIAKNETQIELYESNIAELALKIKLIEKNVAQLENSAKNILNSIYIETKTNSIIDILLSSVEGGTFFSKIQYHMALGIDDQNSLELLHKEKKDLMISKEVMEKSKIEIEKLAEQIKIEEQELLKSKEQLTAQKNQKNKLLQDSKEAANYYGKQYENLTDDQKKAQAQIDLILQQMAFSAGKPKGYAVKGQIIAKEGLNGCTSGPHTHFGIWDGSKQDWIDPCDKLPYKFFWRWPSTTSGRSGICQGDGTFQYIYKDPFDAWRGSTWYHKAIDFNAGTDKNVYAAHEGYYFEETSACSNSWCTVGCKGATKCVKVCQDKNCNPKSGYISIYCHVDFLP